MAGDRAGDWSGAITRAKAHSPFLTRALERHPDIAELLAAGKGEEALAQAKAAGEGKGDVGTALRCERSALALALGIGDLAEAFPVALVMEELSDFADRACDAAIADAILSRVPDAEPAGMVLLALGKHGARELNYSSDIDPIILYDPETLPHRERDEPADAAQRYVRKIVETLSHQTSEGYVFRVDLRLRPASEVSPLAIPVEAAITHYESSALAWERAAYIRARAAAGDVALGVEFLDTIAPFIWRRSLDFGAIDEIRRLSTRIRGHHVGPREPGPGYNVKQGRGGIREVEFFAQTHQLIHGGRRPELRRRGTRETLDALAETGLVSTRVAAGLGDAYDRLRSVEHRLQMVADRQTHSLPEDREALDNVALLSGFADGVELAAYLKEVTDYVAARYDELLSEGDGAGDAAEAPLPPRLETIGFSDPERIAARIEGWTGGKIRALRSEAARDAFEDVLPALLEALGKSPDPERALARWESLIAGLPSAVNLFRLLGARPGLFDQLLSVLTLAPPLADELARRPELLDILIDATVFDLPGSVADLRKKMRRAADGPLYEERLDAVRRIVGETRFALGVQLIEGAHDPLEIASALSRVAEAALAECVEAAQEEFAKAHGRIGDGGIAVLGLGRLGGGALTHASDLDLVYLFDADLGEESDGARPLTATLYFNRLAQRITAALSVPTAEGALYEVDTRLRPQGNQGPIAVSFDAFEKYQREDAWTWEHMALCRARVLAASNATKARLESSIASILTATRDPVSLKADVLKMRAEMLAHKPPKGPLDVKLTRGGLVDLEFIIHFLQLRDGTALHPPLEEAIAELVTAGLLDAQTADAHKLLTRVLVASRLLAPTAEIPNDAASAALVRICGHDSMESLLRALVAARKVVGNQWANMFGEELEIEE